MTSAATMEIDQMSAFLLTSSFFCWSVGGLRFVDMRTFPLSNLVLSDIGGAFPFIVTAFIAKFHHHVVSFTCRLG